MKKKAINTKTFDRSIVIKGSKKDFGLGVGVIVADQITFKDKSGRGFDHGMFYMELMQENDDFMRQHVEVKYKESKPKRRGK